jgi:hypothetical protein
MGQMIPWVEVQQSSHTLAYLLSLDQEFFLAIEPSSKVLASLQLSINSTRVRVCANTLEISWALGK